MLEPGKSKVAWNMKKAKVLILIPAKNEEKILPYALDSILRQKNMYHQKKLVLIDDDSTDNTYNVMMKYVDKYHWIHAVKVVNHKDYPPGVRMTRALLYGLTYAKKKNFNFDYIMKADADTYFFPDYIDSIIAEMEEDKNLGIAGGVTVNEEFDLLHVRDTGMMIRKKLFDEVKGYIPVPNPDTYLQLQAISRGWKIKVVKKAKMLLLRKTGYGTRKTIYSWQQGYTSRIVGYDSIYLLLRFLKITIKQGPKNAIHYLVGVLHGGKEKKYAIRKNTQTKIYYRLKYKAFLYKI